VIIGAGMDSLALRRPGFRPEVEVFEIDHPATQELKLKRLSDARVSLPADVHYIPADLNVTGVDAVLDGSGFDSGRLAFFSRRYRLSVARGEPEDVSIASCGAPGSEVVFNYLDQRIFDSSDEEAQRVRAVFASLSEPWVSGFDPSALSEDLRGVGLELVENLDSEDLRVRYCAAREDGLAPSFGECVARAHITA
jgi:methyltransferase (TIGR00027 family)